MFDLVFDDGNFVIADKPAGWLTVPSRFEAEDERTVLGRELEKSLNARLFPVHRLDFEVSGLVMFARNPRAHREAGQWFEKRQVTKTYQALSAARDFSHWPPDLRRADEAISVGEELEWRCRLLRGKRRSYEHAKGDLAVTRARLEGVDEGTWRWSLHPLTGRAHQLRFEMSRHGFPILGDALYGSKAVWEDKAIALRAVHLDLSQAPGRRDWQLPESFQVKGLF
ncbi:MAG: RNA pseudouridine synthase [Bdellovibrionaceae bacterium]|nr:RNA pseudouridine synthase [Pseudobdellovibrionaceae bacterium]